jgi:hypothetical protein
VKKQSKIESAARGALDTASFGFSPKISGAAASLIVRQLYPELFQDQSFGETYKEGRNYLRGQNEEAFRQNPLSYLTGGLVGGLVSPVKGAGATNLASRVKRGAVLGGLYGLGSSDTGEVGEIEPSNFLDISQSAAVGSLANALLPPALRGVWYVGDKLTPEFVKKGIASVGSYLGKKLNLAPQQRHALEVFKEPVISKEQKTITELAKNATYLEKGSLTAPAIEKIRNQQGVDYGQAHNAYERAKSNVGSLDIKQIKKFIPEIKKELVTESIDPSTHQKTYAFMKSFNSILGKGAPKNAIGIDFQRLEGWRKQLTKAASREPDGAERYGLNQLKKGYDTFIENNIEKALLNGDEKILNSYKSARESWKLFKQTYTAGHKDEYGKKFIQDIINNGRSQEPYSDEMIANKIFGSNKIGFKSQAINIVNELESHLGAQSPEFNNLRLEGLNKVIRPLLESGDNKAAAINKYNLNLKDSLPVLKKLLPKPVIDELEYLGKNGAKLFEGNKINLKALNNVKYVGAAIQAINPNNNLINKIYDKSRKTNNVAPESLSRSISQVLNQPEERAPSSRDQQETSPSLPVEKNYNEILERLTPDQKERLELLRQSMHPVQ